MFAATMTSRPMLAAQPSANKIAARTFAGLKQKSLGRQLTARASKQFDIEEVANEFTAEVVKAWENVDEKKKPVVGAYILGAASAIITAEWLIHQPLLNALLGFPIQLLGLLLLPVLGIRYLKEGADVKKDIEGALNKVTDQLPGFK